MHTETCSLWLWSHISKCRLLFQNYDEKHNEACFIAGARFAVVMTPREARGNIVSNFVDGDRSVPDFRQVHFVVWKEKLFFREIKMPFACWFPMLLRISFYLQFAITPQLVLCHIFTPFLLFQEVGSIIGKVSLPFLLVLSIWVAVSLCFFGM